MRIRQGLLGYIVVLGYYSKCSKKAGTGFWQESKLNTLALKKKKSQLLVLKGQKGDNKCSINGRFSMALRPFSLCGHHIYVASVTPRSLSPALSSFFQSYNLGGHL